MDGLYIGPPYRAMFLRNAQWLDTGSDSARTAGDRRAPARRGRSGTGADRPWGLSRILGITVFLEIPPSLPQIVSLAGGLLLLVGVLLVGVDPRAARPPDRTAG